MPANDSINVSQMAFSSILRSPNDVSSCGTKSLCRALRGCESNLTLHRLVKDYLKKYSPKVISKWERLLPIIADHSSIKEQDSINCERDVEKMKKAQYMENHIGEVYQGVISGVCEFGIFVQLQNTIEGLVKVEDIKGDYYVYDKELGIMMGKNTKNKYMFGDIVKVEVINASRETSMVDFRIVKEEYYGSKKKK